MTKKKTSKLPTNEQPKDLIEKVRKGGVKAAVADLLPHKHFTPFDSSWKPDDLDGTPKFDFRYTLGEFSRTIVKHSIFGDHLATVCPSACPYCKSHRQYVFYETRVITVGINEQIFTNESKASIPSGSYCPTCGFKESWDRGRWADKLYDFDDFERGEM